MAIAQLTTDVSDGYMDPTAVKNCTTKHAQWSLTVTIHITTENLQ